MDAPNPIGQPLVNPSTSKPTPKLQMNTVLKFIILLVILFLISALALTIFLGKKKITPSVTSARTSTITKSSAPQATTATTSMNSINTLMISCKKYNEKTFVSILNLRFYDFLRTFKQQKIIFHRKRMLFYFSHYQ
jgi:hypothetical protein